MSRDDCRGGCRTGLTGANVMGNITWDARHFADIPAWVPQPVNWYLLHTVGGCSLRALARREACHPSTILRHVRRVELRRDDPLVDTALSVLGRSFLNRNDKKEIHSMAAPIRHSGKPTQEGDFARQARRILRRLCESGAFLAIAPDLEMAVVLKEDDTGATTRVAVVPRPAAEAFALKDWIACDKPGRVATYRITGAGRAALKRLLAEQEDTRTGFAEAQSPFAAQHRDMGARMVPGDGLDAPRKLRANLAESPLALLARRRDKDGTPFLPPELVAAGERLREDFELAQMGPRVTQNWDRFLTAGDRGGFRGGGQADGPRDARDRVAAALRDLGPGLGDVVLRCCCFLEGMEAAEKRMGWSARSGKIVLRIALQRLRRHYDENAGPGADLIG